MSIIIGQSGALEKCKFGALDLSLEPIPKRTFAKEWSENIRYFCFLVHEAPMVMHDIEMMLEPPTFFLHVALTGPRSVVI